MKKQMWICVDSNLEEPNYCYYSLAHRRRDSIDLLRENWSWKTIKKLGWKCIKVEVTIKPMNEVK